MLVELGVVEQRHAAVLEVLRDGAEVKEVALRFGVSRQTVHRWLRRYASKGSGGVGGSVAAAGFVSASDAGGGGGFGGWVAAGESGLGSAHVVVRARGSGCGSVAGAVVGVSLPGAPWADPAPGPPAQEGPTTGAGSAGRAMELWQMDVVGGVMLTGRLQGVDRVGDR